MRILIVAFYFPPYDSIAALRPGKFAKYLHQFGHDVRVLSGGRQNLPFATLPVELPQDRVTYAPWIGLRRLTNHRQAVQRVASEPRSTAKLRRALARFGRTFLDAPDAQIGWVPFAIKRGRRILQEWIPDVVFATSGPPSSLLVARNLAKHAGAPWIGDFRDLWANNHAYDLPRWRRAIDRSLERRVLSSAAMLTTVSAPLAELLRATGKRVEVVLNGFDPSDSPNDRRPSLSNELTIVYTGTIYEGKQSPAVLFEAMQLLGDAARAIRVVFLGAPASAVSPLARLYGVRDLVEIRPQQPYALALQAQRDADVLLHLLWLDRDQLGVYGAKIFEYLAARRPILAVGPPENVAALLVTSRSAGLATDSSAAVALQIKLWLSQKAVHGDLADLPSPASEDLTREYQARRIERLMSEVVTEYHARNVRRT